MYCHMRLSKLLGTCKRGVAYHAIPTGSLVLVGRLLAFDCWLRGIVQVLLSGITPDYASTLLTWQEARICDHDHDHLDGVDSMLH